MNILIDRNYRTGKTCKYHCFPSCHPEQIDENDVKYGCTHHVWTCKRNGEFVPIVKCGGNPKNCPLKDPIYKDMICDYLPELKKIMGSPEDYVLIGSQADQKKFIGNAVEVNMARVLCEALVSKLQVNKLITV